MRAMTRSVFPGVRRTLALLLLAGAFVAPPTLAREQAAKQDGGFEFAGMVMAGMADVPPARSVWTPAEAPRQSILNSLGKGVVDTASTLTFALTDGVRDTVLGTASLAGSVTGAVTDTVKNTVSGTAQVAGSVGDAVGGAVKTTVVGTLNVAGAVGGAVGNVVTDTVRYTVSGTASAAGYVGGAVKATALGTWNAAGSVTGIVSDTVRSTVAGTVNVAGAVVGGVGSTVGAVTDVAKTLLDAPQRMIQYATTMLGTPYKWGGNTIESGLDCSGFVREVVQATTGRLLPRTAKEMSNQGKQVAFGEMKPGDLVFFNTRRKPFSHVGIYLGDGRFMHGASGVKSGKQVRIDSFNSSYYRTRFNGARRVANPEQIASGTELIGATAKP